MAVGRQAGLAGRGSQWLARCRFILQKIVVHGKGDGIKSRPPFKIFSTLAVNLIQFQADFRNLVQLCCVVLQLDTASSKTAAVALGGGGGAAGSRQAGRFGRPW